MQIVWNEERKAKVQNQPVIVIFIISHILCVHMINWYSKEKWEIEGIWWVIIRYFDIREIGQWNAREKSEKSDLCSFYRFSHSPPNNLIHEIRMKYQFVTFHTPTGSSARNSVE